MTAKMKKILLIVLLLTHLCPPIRAAKDTNIDSLLLITEQHDQARLVSAANQLMNLFYEEKTSDQSLRFLHSTPADTIRMYTWYWASEHFLASNDYTQSLKYSLLALPLCRQSKNRQLLGDCLSVAAISQEETRYQLHVKAFTLIVMTLIAAAAIIIRRRRRKHRLADIPISEPNSAEDTGQPQSSSSTKGVHEPDEKFVQDLRCEIKQRLPAGMISLEELASAMYMSRGQLNRRVKALTGLTTSSYILSLRLDMACNLLQQFPDKPINEVAQQCGFDNFSYFNRLFKREKGVTPSEYKGSC